MTVNDLRKLLEGLDGDKELYTWNQPNHQGHSAYSVESIGHHGDDYVLLPHRVLPPDWVCSGQVNERRAAASRERTSHDQ